MRRNLNVISENSLNMFFIPKITKGKKELFEVWGYDKADSEMLQRVFEKQAIEKYIQGQYVLGKIE